MGLIVWLPLTGTLENKGLLKIKDFTNSGATVDNNGKIGKCYSFSSKILSSTTNSNINLSISGPWSASAWIYPTSFGTHNYIVSIGGTSSTSFLFSLCLYSSGYPAVRVGGSTYYSSSITVPLETWSHLGFTFNGSQIKIYLNGSLLYTKNSPASPVAANSVYIGARGGNTGYYQGKLNDVRIYDYCLSDKEMKELSQALILHWKLDSDDRLNNQPKRNPNFLTPSILNNSAPWKNSIQGTEIYKDKSAILMRTNTLYQNTSSSTTSIFPNLTFKSNTQYTLSVTWCDHLRTDSYSSSLILFFRYDDGTSSYSSIRLISPTANNTADWTHTKITSEANKTVSMICASYGRAGNVSIADIKLEEGTNDTGISLSNESVYNSDGYILPISAKRLEYIQSDGNAYINTGIPYDSTKSTYRIECKFSQPSNVGNYDAIFGAYTGESNKCIRIIRLNSNSKMSFYYNNQANTSNRITLSTTNTNIREVIMTSSSFICTESGTSNTYTAPTINGNNITSTFYLFCQGIVNGSPSCLSNSRIYYFRLYDNDTLIKEFIPVEYNEEYGMWETVNKEFYPNSNSTGEFIAGPEINIIYDSSGYKHNGYTICNKTFDNNTPRYNYCLKNTNEYPCKTLTSIDFPESNGLTIACWMNITTWGQSTSGLWATSNLTDPTDYSTTTCNHRDSCFDMRGTNGTTYRLTCNSTDIPKNTWKYVVITHDGANAKLYINGSLIRTLEVPTSLVGFKYFYLGYSFAGSVIRKCLGSWSDLRIYATALSESAILKLYNNPAHIDNKHNIYGFEFNEWNITNPKILKRGIIEIDEFEEDNELQNIKFIKKSIIPNQIIEK